MQKPLGGQEKKVEETNSLIWKVRKIKKSGIERREGITDDMKS